MMHLFRSRLLFAQSWNHRLRRTRAATRVVGHNAQNQAITEAATHAVLTREGCRDKTVAVAKATIEREATRAWAREQREKFGFRDDYDRADLAFGLVERRNRPGYRTRFPMWQRVLYLEQDGVLDEDAAAFLGSDPVTVAFELPIAYAHLSPPTECRNRR